MKCPKCYSETKQHKIGKNKGLTFRMGQTHVHRYMRPLLEHIQRGAIDPSFIVTHRLPLEEAPHAYEIFKDKEDEFVKVELKP